MRDPYSLLAEASPGSIGWFWAAAATIIGTLASAVAFMYRGQIAMKDAEIKAGKDREEILNKQYDETKQEYQKVFDKLQEEIDECRKDREDLRVQMATVETRLALLEESERKTSHHEGKIDQRLDTLENDSN